MAWSQFKKINDDEDILPEDNFLYLLQATAVGSGARELVENLLYFTPTYCNVASSAVRGIVTLNSLNIATKMRFALSQKSNDRNVIFTTIGTCINLL